MIGRRGFLLGSGLVVAGCENASRSPDVLKLLGSAERLTMSTQRLIGHDALATEFQAADISPIFKANGNVDPASPSYRAHRGSGFVNWRIAVDGLVRRPLSLGLADLAAMPQRTQITRHDCVEGWSAIGEWSGAVLAPILAAAGAREGARYVVFHCADSFGANRYYESVDMVDALHPQTILATRLNGRPLPVGNGAPARLRVERMLGYKHAKYVERIELRATLAGIGRGRGGYWPDRGYEWYAGI